MIGGAVESGSRFRPREALVILDGFMTISPLRGGCRESRRKLAVAGSCACVTVPVSAISRTPRAAKRDGGSG